jgi:hypothetical protein
MYSGRPDEKPVKTQISIRRLNSASRQVSRGGATGGLAGAASPAGVTGGGSRSGAGPALWLIDRF